MPRGTVGHRAVGTIGVSPFPYRIADNSYTTEAIMWPEQLWNGECRAILWLRLRGRSRINTSLTEYLVDEGTFNLCDHGTPSRLRFVS